MHSFTPDDLLLYLYNEASPEMTTAIEAALEEDYSLRESLNELRDSIDNLESVELSPRKQSIDKILQYAENGIGELTHD